MAVLIGSFLKGIWIARAFLFSIRSFKALGHAPDKKLGAKIIDIFSILCFGITNFKLSKQDVPIFCQHHRKSIS